MKKLFTYVLFSILFFFMGNLYFLFGQSGHRSILNNDGSTISITSESSLNKPLTLYAGDIEQKIQNLMFDKSPTSIVLLVDGSLSTKIDLISIKRAVQEFSYEIYENDKLFIVKYANSAQVESEWTDDPKLIASLIKNWGKAGDPHLFDALSATADQAMRPLVNRKRAIVILTDGVDIGSKIRFDDVLADLQRFDITVYILQIEDRVTNGSGTNKDGLNPDQVIERLAKETGGLVFKIEVASNAAKSICDELKLNRYLLFYEPIGITLDHSRRILILDNQSNPVRSKTVQPSNQKPA